MARKPRQISETGVYHVIFRGINKQTIFEEEKDYFKMKNILLQIKQEMAFDVYVYCFMDNHVHLLIKEKKQGDISLIMKRLLSTYARWYNFKYDRSGALIANRYKSQPVEIDPYFLSLVRYIHQNPLKAGIVSKLEDYKWSSYSGYITNSDELIEKKFVLDMIGVDDFKDFHKIEEENVFVVSDRYMVDDAAIKREIIKKYKIEPKEIAMLEKKERNELLQELKKEFSIRQLERVTGVSRGIIYKS